jgi:small subunit ribosomal protein S19
MSSKSAWKLPYISQLFFTKKFNYVKEDEKGKEPKYPIWSRRSLISKNFISKKVRLYNGLKFLTVEIGPLMVGHKMGEFSITKVLKNSGKKKKKGKK